MTDPRMLALIDDSLAHPAEVAWLEFKKDYTKPCVIGRLISAVSNAARLEGKDFGYVVWGVRDDDHAVVGTRFQPESARHRRRRTVAVEWQGLDRILMAGLCRCEYGGLSRRKTSNKQLVVRGVNI